jgi:hypothetical protein
MTSLPPHADQVVHDAVDAFMEGRLVPDFVGETAFETKNSRYRLLDGVVIAGPDPSLVGAELVGWLCESGRRCLVESAWQPGSRAVLVDRQRGRDIIVTSTTRLLHLEETSTSRPSRPQAAPAQFRSWHPPPAEHTSPEPPSPPAPPLEPQQPRVIIAATPAPAPAAETPLPSPRKPAVHLPPRPIAPQAALPPPVLPPPAPRPILRPLPVPLPPPRRPTPVPPPPAPETPWEVTSAELQVVDEEAIALDDATQQAPPEADSLPSIPIDLVRLLRPHLGDDDPRQ